MSGWTNIVKWSRIAAVSCFITASFFAYPLAFLRLSGNKIPYYGLAEAVTLPGLGIVAAALLLANTSWIGLYRKDRHLQFFGAAQILLLLLTIYHRIAGTASFHDVALSIFFITAPTLGMEFSRELRRILPVAGSVFALLLLFSGIMSEQFTGLCGNWNWTQGMLFALLPGIFILFDTARYRQWAVGSAVIAALIFMLTDPEIFSRSVLLGVFLIPLLIKGNGQLPEKWKFPVIVLGFAGIVAMILTIAAAVDLPDSRVQLWKGSLDLLLNRAWLGCGMGKFSEVILPYLPEKYYFTAFAAPMHPHPHNEILNFFCSYGIAGVVFLGALIFTALKKGPETEIQWYGQWIFLFLLLCGCFDVHCAILPGAAWFWLIPGMLTADGEAEKIDRRRWKLLRVAAALLMIMAVLWKSAEHFRAGYFLRRGEIALSSGDFPAGRKFLEKSLSIKILPHAAYRMAELYLHIFNEPQKCTDVLDALYTERKIINYLHSRRLRAVAYSRTGKNVRSKEHLLAEVENYPYSIINARLLFIQKQHEKAPEPELRAAWSKLLKLCALRKITVAESASISAEKDDRGYDVPGAW